jgi:hypothetical protein
LIYVVFHGKRRVGMQLEDESARPDANHLLNFDGLT